MTDQNAKLIAKKQKYARLKEICGSPTFSAKVLTKIYRRRFEELNDVELIEVRNLVKKGYVIVDTSEKGDRIAQTTLEIFGEQK